MVLARKGSGVFFGQRLTTGGYRWPKETPYYQLTILSRCLVSRSIDFEDAQTKQLHPGDDQDN
ncbi:MAG: hypothetical protein QGF59_22575, partial [Pirellulaceae bacterium]|nr:hypothetical protein [Pirellulaceae bacterium]